ncbi:MAG TPA: nucleotidyltransferase family protein [Elusimicrobiales bacterium]|nr:nucleotidyltransferase family protein [Elusimicrobiales bacterium]
MKIKAVIIAGGLATRMGHLTKRIPKAMLSIKGKPIIARQIQVCKRYGVKDFYIAAGHLSHIICDYFAGDRKGININCFVEKKTLGTGGALKQLESELDGDFLVIYGDMFFDINLKKLIDFHRRKKSDLTAVVHPNDYPQDCDLVKLNKNCRMTAVYKKPHGKKKIDTNLSNTGLYVFTKKALGFIRKNKSCDIAQDILPAVVKKLKVFGYLTDEYIRDAGTPARFRQVTKDFTSGKTKINLK